MVPSEDLLCYTLQKWPTLDCMYHFWTSNLAEDPSNHLKHIKKTQRPMVTSIAMLAETPVIYLLLPVMRENVKKMDLLTWKCESFWMSHLCSLGCSTSASIKRCGWFENKMFLSILRRWGKSKTFHSLSVGSVASRDCDCFGNEVVDCKV